MKTRFAAGIGLALALSMISTQTALAGGFKSSLSAGVTLTDGNSETLLANGTLVTEGEKEGLGSLRAGIEANYGESKLDDQKETTVDNARIFANLKKTISPRFFVSLDSFALTDDIAEIDYRVAIGPGLGVYLLKNPTTSLSTEVGPSYIWEKVADVTDDYLAVRFTERFEHAFSDTSKIWQSAEYMPKSDEFSDYLLSAEVGAEAALNSRLSLRIVLRNTHDSSPADDVEKNDLTLIAGIKLAL